MEVSGLLHVGVTLPVGAAPSIAVCWGFYGPQSQCRRHDERNFIPLFGMEHPTVSFERRIRDVAVPAHNETTILTDYEVLLEYPNYVGLLTAERRLIADTWF